MTIVALDHVTLVARRADAPALLARMQRLGLLHLEALGRNGAGFDAAIDARIRAAFAWLARTRLQRHRQWSPDGFDAAGLVARVEEIRAELKALEEERLALLKRIGDVRPWGDFAFRPVLHHPELRLWFYEVPSGRMAEIEGSGHVWAEVGHDAQRRFVVVIARDEPAGIPLMRIHVGSHSLATLETQLNVVEVRIDDLQAERAGLTRWLGQFRQEMDRLADRQLHAEALSRLDGEGALVVAEGWVARERGSLLAEAALAEGAALCTRPPRAGETPPTLLSNAPALAPGEALVRFFLTPDYHSWDPTAVVLASFTLFFAIIIGDAVYGTLFGLALLAGWRALGRSAPRRRMRLILLLLAAATTGWGMLVGTYAGAPPPLPLLERLHMVPSGDTRLMLALSIGIGLAHLILANAVAARRLWPHPTARARIGWILLFLAAPLFLLRPPAMPVLLPAAGGGLGLLLVLCCSSDAAAPLARFGAGALALTRLVGALGDTLSYLRLFALAIAGTSLAAAFNALAVKAWAVPGVGVLFGLLILLLGHGLNLALGVASGVVHGLRLNYIEFFGWGLWGEGRPFRAFAMREKP